MSRPSMVMVSSLRWAGGYWREGEAGREGRGGMEERRNVDWFGEWERGSI